jgi:hypothetical protein
MSQVLLQCGGRPGGHVANTTQKYDMTYAQERNVNVALSCGMLQPRVTFFRMNRATLQGM